jgi:hypothetical protein
MFLMPSFPLEMIYEWKSPIGWLWSEGERSEPSVTASQWVSRTSAPVSSEFGNCFFPLFVFFLLRQEIGTAVLDQRTAVAWTSSRSPWTAFSQSVAQQEPNMPDAPNSNRCQSVGTGQQLVFVRMS